MSISNGEKPKHDTVMDVTVEQVARVYAQAFMNVAAKQSNSDELVQELTSVVDDVLDRFPQFERTIESSLVTPEQKEQVLERVFSKTASPQVLYFLKVLSRHGRLELLRPVARQVKKLQAERSGLTDVEVRVAAELDDALRSDIVSRLQKTFGKTPVLNVKIDPSIVAGIVVRVGDRVYDGSLHTQLERARVAMIERSKEQIETQPDRFLSPAN
jgi:F-type H+-transporting ATPase subunit delta